MEDTTISDVLQNLALCLVADKDGRNLDEHTMGALNAVAEVAAWLDLPDAEQFRTLSNTALRGFTRDLKRAALAIFLEP